MGAKSKHTEDKIAKAVQRYAAGEQVSALAKEFKVSVPGMYLWINKAKEQAATQAKQARMSPETKAIDKKINIELQNRALLDENERLKRKLLELMLKSGEL